MHPKNFLYLAAAALVALALYLTWLWQPERQVARHQANLLQALSRRNWPKVEAFFAKDYADRWDHDREGALRDCRIALAQFFSLEIQAQNASSVVEEALEP